MKRLEAEVVQANEDVRCLTSDLGSSNAHLQAEQKDNARLLEESRVLHEQVSSLNDTILQARRELVLRSEK